MTRGKPWVDALTGALLALPTAPSFRGPSEKSLSSGGGTGRSRRHAPRFDNPGGEEPSRSMEEARWTVSQPTTAE